MHQPNPKPFNGLDHLRAFAILLVFIFHYAIITGGGPSWLQEVSKVGWTGVDLFFVLSGFLISSQLFKEISETGRFSCKRFFLKRCFRILPAYWCVLALYFCFPAFHERESLPPLWRFLTFTQNIGLDLKTEGTFSHAWSLCVEEHFYLLLPLTLLLLLRLPMLYKKSSWLLPALFTLCIVVRYFSFQQFYLPHVGSASAPYDWFQFIYYPTWCRLDGLVLGVTLGALYCYRPAVWNKISALGNWLFLFSLLVFAVAYRYFSEQQSAAGSVFGFSLVAIGYAFLLAGCMSPKTLLYKWRSGATRFLAAVSYAVYLSHKGIIHITLLWLGHRVDANSLFFICILSSVTGACLLYWLIEKPFMRWRRKLVKPVRHPVPGHSLKRVTTE